ncbi:hypothetical protein KFU94_40720 [Chloroflexi bacterium TSY]|nr:hypothetical protein [Chloroflexi bacterium TSY]
MKTLLNRRVRLVIGHILVGALVLVAMAFLLQQLFLTMGLMQTAGSILLTSRMPHLSPNHGATEAKALGDSTSKQPALITVEPNDDPINMVLYRSAWQAWRALPSEYKKKVDPRILAELAGDVEPTHLRRSQADRPFESQAPRSQTRFLVYLRTQINPQQALQNRVFASALEQRQTVLSILNEHAQVSQSGVRTQLEASLTTGDVASYHAFYIVNALAVDGGLATIVDLARRYDVERIVANYPLVPLWNGAQFPALLLSKTAPLAAKERLFGLQKRSLLSSDAKISSKTFLEKKMVMRPNRQFDVPSLNWNIELVEANRVWRGLHVRGEGVVVAGFDTGVVYQHPAIVDKYRGNEGGEFNHNYNWFEPDSHLYPDGNLGPSAGVVQN